jgi:hypothetical protein
MKTMRFSTLVRDFGPCRLAPTTNRDYRRAVERGRVLTIHHGERARDALYGEPGHHVCNVVERVAFRRPLPAGLITVTGINRSLITT